MSDEMNRVLAALGHVVEDLKPSRQPTPAHSLYATALALWHRDYAVIPICAPVASGRCTVAWHHPCSRIGKRPIYQGFTNYGDTLPTLAALRSLYRYASGNVALVIPHNCIAVEADNPAGDQELAELIDDTATPTRLPRTNRGHAYLFRLPQGCVAPRRVHLGATKAIDVITAGGILIIPPSVHASGHHYEWLPGCSPSEIDTARIPRRLLEFILPTKTAIAPSVTDNDAPLTPIQPDELRSRLPLRVQTLAIDGYREGGGFRSRSELRYVLMLAAIRCGADKDTTQALIRTVPAAFPTDRPRARVSYQLSRDWIAAYAEHLRAPCTSVLVRLHHVCYGRMQREKVTATIYLELAQPLPLAVTLTQYGAQLTIAVPSTQWHEALRAFPAETMLATLPARPHGNAISLAGRRSRAWAIFTPRGEIIGLRPL